LALSLNAGGCDAESGQPRTEQAQLEASGSDASPAVIALEEGANGPLLPGGPGAQRGVRGVGGLCAVTRVRFRAEPDAPHLFTTTFSLPQRAEHRVLREGSGARTIEWRYGDLAFSLPQGSGSSLQLEGKQRERLLRHLDLRLATFLWPEAFAWEGQGAERTAALPSNGAGLGSLVASMDAEGERPTQVVVRDPAGVPLERLQIHSWNELEPRSWPAELSFDQFVDGVATPIWSEVLVSASTAARFQDEYFLPPDRRPEEGGGLETISPEHVLLPPVTQRTLPLDLQPGTSWIEALGVARELQEQERLRGGVEQAPLAPELVLELDEQGLPIALLLRLQGAPEPAPDGWERIPGREGWSLRIDAPLGPDPSWLQLLRRQAGAAGATTRAYARVNEAAGRSSRLQLVLPSAR